MNYFLIKLAPFLFKPSLRHTQPKIRLLALERLNLAHNTGRQDFLHWLQQEQDLQLIQQFLPKYPHLEDLAQLLGAPQVASPELEQLLEEHLAHSLIHQNLDAELKLRLAQPLMQSHLALELIQELEPASLGYELALNLETSQQNWLQIALKHKLAKTRHLAASKLEQIELLEQLAQAATHDKNLLRLAKEKLQAHKNEQETLAKNAQLKIQTLEQLRQLVTGADTNLYAAKFEHLKQQWHSLEAAADIAENEKTAESQEFARLHQAATAFLAEIAAQEAAQKEAAAQKRLAQEREQQRLEQEHLQRQLEIEQQRQEQAQLAKQLQEQQTAESQANNNQSNNAQASEEISPEQQAPAFNFKQLEQDLLQLEKLLQTGASNEALRLHKKLRSTAENLNNSALVSGVKNTSQPQNTSQLKNIPQLQNKWKALNAQVAEIKSWQGFAAGPKREELCQQMEDLASDTEMLPQIKADKIQALQQEWRQLGAAAANKALWERFKQAADIAYAPCQEWFSQQNQIRQHNQTQKAVICQQLEALINSGDYLQLLEKPLGDLIEQIYAEWNSFNPVNRVEGRQLAQRFQQAMQPLKERFYNFQQAHALAKQELIQQAQALLQQENLSAAIQTSKQIQQDWRQLGRAPGRQEHQLWKEFRALCDELFAKQSQERAEQQQERVQLFNAGLEVLSQIKLALADKNLNAAQQLVQQLPDSRDLPKKEQNSWQVQVKQINQELNQYLQAQQRQEFGSKLQQLLEVISNQPAQETTPENLAIQAKALIELEFLCGITPPAAEQQQLLEIQIERMNKGKGTPSATERNQEIQQLLETWLAAAGNLASPSYARLQAAVKNYSLNS